MMDYFPIFVAMKQRSVMVVGAGEVAVAKLRLLLKTSAQIHVFDPIACDQVKVWAGEKKIIWHQAFPEKHHFQNLAFVYLALPAHHDDMKKQMAHYAHQANLLVNMVDDISSDFYTPAMVDRAPLVVAIGSQGAAPVLTQKIKMHLESFLSPCLGTVVSLAQKWREKIIHFNGKDRLALWKSFWHAPIEKIFEKNGEKGLTALFNDMMAGKNTHPQRADLSLLVACHDDPGLMTMKAHVALGKAQHVFYDPQVSPQIIECVRRESTYHCVRDQEQMHYFHQHLWPALKKGQSVVWIHSRCAAQKQTLEVLSPFLDHHKMFWQVLDHVQGAPWPCDDMKNQRQKVAQPLPHEMESVALMR